MVDQIRLRNARYDRQVGRIQNQETVGEYSYHYSKLTELTFSLDRRFALQLKEENISENTALDLKAGFLDRTENENSLGAPNFPLLHWACTQPGANLGEAMKGADFAAHRDMLASIARTLVKSRWADDTTQWMFVAVKTSGIILLSEVDFSLFPAQSDEEEEREEKREEEKKVEKKDVVEEDPEVRKERIRRKVEQRLQWYSGWNFQRIMTTSEHNSRDQVRLSSYSTNQITLEFQYEHVVISDLHAAGQEPIKLCCHAEIDALKGDAPVEINSTFKDSFQRVLYNVMKNEMGNVNTNVTGFRDDKFIIRKVLERSNEDLKKFLGKGTRPGDSEPVEKCLAFLYDVLATVKDMLERHPACRFWYLPTAKIVQFEPITLREADDYGCGVPEFVQKRFEQEDS